MATVSQIGPQVSVFEEEWIDPVQEDQELTRFRVYRQPSRDEEGAEGSYQIYLPPTYASQPGRRFRVLYWLHGGFAHSRQCGPAVARIDRAIRSGLMDPVIVVSPQALPTGWYVDSRDGARPVEQVIAGDLVRHVDATYRTVSGPGSRAIEGFSMGGFGALHLGFKYPKLFGQVSAVAPTVLRRLSQEPEERIADTFFGDQAYYDAVAPWTLLRANVSEIRKHQKIRLLGGAEDARPAAALRELGAEATELGVRHEFHESAGAGHDYEDIVDALGDRYVTFWNS
ncbi:alpha/beta hydrolase [Streptomyces sp. cg40]|uniref:alpha/beta hydrolase n=1 Tax=Streptomyces sp. cg40 TaxID=3419764 RepID=UPI003D07051A